MKTVQGRKENVTKTPARQQSLSAAPTQKPYGMAGFLLNLQYTHGNHYVQRLLDERQRSQPSTVPPIVHEVLRSPGQPLDPATRAFMEPRFGHDFGRVRVHADVRAAESARALDALAYTVGQRIVFGAEQYRPGTLHGKHLLAHELTHTIQQSAMAGDMHSRLEFSRTGDPVEREADVMARLIAEGQAISITRDRGATIARQPLPEAVAPVDPGIDLGAAITEDPGQKRARVARELIAKLKDAGTTYKQENPRDWDNMKVADCSKFVQWVLEAAGEGQLFGREHARTSMMQSIIKELTKDEMLPFRLSEPKVGDIMMWGGHVGIVAELVVKDGTTYLVFTHMGASGPNLIGKTMKGGRDIYWLKASDIAKIDSMGSGEFLGFWTPP